MTGAQGGHGARAHLRDAGRIDNRPWLPRTGVHQDQDRKLGRQTDAVVAVEVTDDLHAGQPERQHDPAQHVEVPVDRRIGLEVHARLEHGPSLALRVQRRLYRIEDLIIRQRQLLDVGTVQVRQIQALHGARPYSRLLRHSPVAEDSGRSQVPGSGVGARRSPRR
jgi:hypothetical protein